VYLSIGVQKRPPIGVQLHADKHTFSWRLGAVLPLVACERMSIGRLMLARAAASAAVRRLTAKSPGTFAGNGDLGHLKRNIAAVAHDLHSDLDQLFL
jgi:hypothetical protein